MVGSSAARFSPTRLLCMTAGEQASPSVPLSTVQQPAVASNSGFSCSWAGNWSFIGRNINQIARWANTQKAISEAELSGVTDLIDQAWRLVKNNL